MLMMALAFQHYYFLPAAVTAVSCCKMLCWPCVEPELNTLFWSTHFLVKHHLFNMSKPCSRLMHLIFGKRKMAEKHFPFLFQNMSAKRFGCTPKKRGYIRKIEKQCLWQAYCIIWGIFSYVNRLIKSWIGSINYSSNGCLAHSKDAM